MRVRTPPKKGAIPLRIRSLRISKINASYQCESAHPKKGRNELRIRSLRKSKINASYQCESALPQKRAQSHCASARSVTQRLTRAINASPRTPPKKGAIPLRIRSLHNTKINERYQCERLPPAACCLRRTRCTRLPIFCRRDGRTRQESSSNCRGKGFSCPSRSRGFRSRTSS